MVLQSVVDLRHETTKRGIEKVLFRQWKHCNLRLLAALSSKVTESATVHSLAEA